VSAQARNRDITSTAGEVADAPQADVESRVDVLA
jgi:hypothetical protein